jgi:hypothetical protein
MDRSPTSSLRPGLTCAKGLRARTHEFQPKQRSRSWLDSSLEDRQRLRDDLEESPSLRGHLETVFPEAYAGARARAITQTGSAERAVPQTSPYTLQQALDPDFVPD